MKRIWIALTLLCLLVMTAVPALAGGIEGAWGEINHGGTFVEIPQDWRMMLRLPTGWSDFETGGSVAQTVSRDGEIILTIYWIDEDFWTYTTRLEDEYADEYIETARLILAQDRDWWVGLESGGLFAACPDADGEYTLAFGFEMPDDDDCYALARSVLSSVLTAE